MFRGVPGSGTGGDRGGTRVSRRPGRRIPERQRVLDAGVGRVRTGIVVCWAAEPEGSEVGPRQRDRSVPGTGTAEQRTVIGVSRAAGPVSVTGGDRGRTGMSLSAGPRCPYQPNRGVAISSTGATGTGQPVDGRGGAARVGAPRAPGGTEGGPEAVPPLPRVHPPARVPLPAAATCGVCFPRSPAPPPPIGRYMTSAMTSRAELGTPPFIGRGTPVSGATRGGGAEFGQ